MTVVIETDYVTVMPTPTLTPPSADSSTLEILLSTTPPILHSSTATPTASPLSVIDTTLPLAFNPAPHTAPKANNTIIILLLVLVIVLASLLCGLIGYFLYLRCRGRCLRCRDLEAQVKKWENGELKQITSEMLRKREKLNGGFEEVDLGRGSSVHAETLGRLEATEKMPFWKNLFGKVHGKTAEKTMEIQPTQPSSVMSDGIFLVVDSPSVRDTSTSSHTQSNKHSDFEVDNNHPIHRPASSIYSQPTVIGQSLWSFKEYPITNMPSIDNVNRADHVAQKGSRPALFAGGDLADPRIFEDLDEKDEQREYETVSTVSSYKQPGWRLNKRFSDRGRRENSKDGD